MVSRNIIETLSERVFQQVAHLDTEEATKHALVLPFIQALGYDVFNPQEVVPEFNADYGMKQGEKVDYAIMMDNTPVILMECKKVGDPLDSRKASQLGRYFNMTPARIGILTDGITYKFYSDIDSPNQMDETPFLEFDLKNPDARTITNLSHFAKSTFNVEAACEAAANLRYIGGIKNYLITMHEEPDAPFVELMTRRIYRGVLTQSRRESFAVLVKSAFQAFVNDRINETLRRASSIVDQEQWETTTDRPHPQPEESINKTSSTTAEEIEGFQIIKNLLSTEVDTNRIYMRDVQSYCGVLLDDSNRKPIARLYFNSPTIRYLETFESRESPIKHQIESVNDIEQHTDRLKATIHNYDNGTQIPGPIALGISDIQ